ncbi:MAG: hypothetical protein CUN52_08440 [Phototrophicales bacterium]|nr:MAG: hypothetical protein CUN52_08440 [Phototrophicales bacterium]
MPKKDAKQPTFWEQITSMNRLLRLFVVTIFAISTTLAISPLIDSIYLQYFFSPETRIIPSLIAMIGGVCMYIVGWIYLVGSARQIILVTRGLKWYMYIGIGTIIIILLWMTGLLLVSL